MNLALEIACERSCSARRVGSRILMRSLTNEYLAFQPSASLQRMLTRSNVEHFQIDGQTVILGPQAAEWSQIARVPTTPLLEGGRLPQNDSLGRQLLGYCIDQLVPEARSSEDQCLLSVPLGQLSDEEANFLSRLVRLKGYHTELISKSYALTLAGLGQRNFTGWGLYVDADVTYVSVCHQAQELASWTIPTGYAWVLEEAAESADCYLWDERGSRFLNLDFVRGIVQGQAEDSSETMTMVSALLAERTADLLHQLCSAVQQQLRDSSLNELRVSRELPIVISGDLTRFEKFEELLAQSWRRTVTDWSLSEIIAPPKRELAIVRGGLILGELFQKPEAIAA